jgi:hypothetical protein
MPSTKESFPLPPPASDVTAMLVKFTTRTLAEGKLSFSKMYSMGEPEAKEKSRS